MGGFYDITVRALYSTVAPQLWQPLSVVNESYEASNAGGAALHMIGIIEYITFSAPGSQYLVAEGLMSGNRKNLDSRQLMTLQKAVPTLTGMELVEQCSWSLP